jgi:excisionase family DNA binding protein
MAEYTTTQAAKKLGIGRDTMYRWIQAKLIRPGRVTRFGNYQIRAWADEDLAKIREWMKKNPHENRGRKKEV